jgi:hypothetical protein
MLPEAARAACVVLVLGLGLGLSASDLPSSPETLSLPHQAGSAALERQKALEILRTFSSEGTAAGTFPEPDRCPSCPVLLKAIENASILAAEIPSLAGEPSERSFEEIATDSFDPMQETLLRLCKICPDPVDVCDFERRFRYHSWTPAGVRLSELARLCSEPVVAGACEP